MKRILKRFVKGVGILHKEVGLTLRDKVPIPKKTKQVLHEPTTADFWRIQRILRVMMIMEKILKSQKGIMVKAMKRIASMGHR